MIAGSHTLCKTFGFVRLRISEIESLACSIIAKGVSALFSVCQLHRIAGVLSEPTQ